MARRRMLSLKVIDTDEFLDMPQSSQYLYFNLAMRADDDGFLSNPKRIQRMICCNDDDLRILSAKKYIIPFETGVCVIRHWRIHNLIRADRYTETECREEKALLRQKNGKYELEKENVIPNGNQMAPQVRSGEDRVGKDICDADAPPDTTGTIINSLIQEFEPINPSFARFYPNKTQRAALERLLKQHGEDQLRVIIQFLQKTNGRKYAPTITTPNQLEEKLASLKTFCEKQKDVAMPKPAKEIIGL